MKGLTFSGMSSPTTVNHLQKSVTDSVNCEKLAAASADVHLEQPLVQLTPNLGPQPELDWRVFSVLV